MENGWKLSIYRWFAYDNYGFPVSYLIFLKQVGNVTEINRNQREGSDCKKKTWAAVLFLTLEEPAGDVLGTFQLRQTMIFLDPNGLSGSSCISQNKNWANPVAYLEAYQVC